MGRDAAHVDVQRGAVLGGRDDAVAQPVDETAGHRGRIGGEPMRRVDTRPGAEWPVRVPSPNCPKFLLPHVHTEVAAEITCRPARWRP